MKPAQVILIRHAESQAHVDKTLYARVPDWQIELTDLGREQASAAGDRLRANLTSNLGVYISPYRRTLQTWDTISGRLGAAAQFTKQDPRLREQERGNIRDRAVAGWDDVWRERQAQGPFFYRFPNGESGADLYDRCTTFLDTLHRDFEKPTFPSTVLIVTHSFTLRVLLMRWLHWTVDQFHQLDDPANGAMFRLVLGANGKYQLSEPFPGLSQ